MSCCVEWGPFAPVQGFPSKADDNHAPLPFSALSESRKSGSRRKQKIHSFEFSQFCLMGSNLAYRRHSGARVRAPYGKRSRLTH